MVVRVGDVGVVTIEPLEPSKGAAETSPFELDLDVEAEAEAKAIAWPLFDVVTSIGFL